MLLNSLIVDDEKLSRDLLRSMLTDLCPQAKVTGEAECAEEAIDAIERTHPDIVFLDIEIPDGDGFELLSKIRGKYHFQTVFVTAFNQYAVKAIRAGARDYLLKPLDGGELKNTVDKLYKNHLEILRKEAYTIPESLNIKITLPHQKGFKIVHLKDIVRLEADNNYTYIYFDNEPRIIVSKPIKYFEDKLEYRWFYRLHKSHIINFFHFKEFLSEDGGSAVMSDCKKIPISRLRMDDFHQYISTFASRF